jgi:CRISPR system Cascade subunit CasE
MMDTLHMVQLSLEMPRLVAAAQRAGLPLREVDEGYLVHRGLAALFSDAAPKPFRAVDPTSRWLTVLAYTELTADALREQAQTFARPDAFETCRWDQVAVKAMPSSWTSGKTLGFEVRVCPVVRLASATQARAHDGSQGTWKKGAELDAFLHRRYLQQHDGDRESVYVDWLRRRLDGAAGLLDVRLQAFRRVRVLRRGRRDGEGKRKTQVAERPDALLTGTLGVTDPDAFRDLLARGVGRHRAFGFGMLLLRAPGRR